MNFFSLFISIHRDQQPRMRTAIKCISKVRSLVKLQQLV